MFRVLQYIRSYDVVFERFRNLEPDDVIGYIVCNEIVIPREAEQLEQVQIDYNRNLLSDDEYIQELIRLGIVEEII